MRGGTWCTRPGSRSAAGGWHGDGTDAVTRPGHAAVPRPHSRCLCTDLSEPGCQGAVLCRSARRWPRARAGKKAGWRLGAPLLPTGFRRVCGHHPGRPPCLLPSICGSSRPSCVRRVSVSCRVLALGRFPCCSRSLCGLILSLVTRPAGFVLPERDPSPGFRHFSSRDPGSFEWLCVVDGTGHVGEELEEAVTSLTCSGNKSWTAE